MWHSLKTTIHNSIIPYIMHSKICVIVFEMVQRMKKLIMHEMKNDNPILKMNSHTKLILISPKIEFMRITRFMLFKMFNFFSLTYLIVNNEIWGFSFDVFIKNNFLAKINHFIKSLYICWFMIIQVINIMWIESFNLNKWNFILLVPNIHLLK